MKTETAEPTTVGEMLLEEFLKPMDMSSHELADLMKITDKRIEDILMNFKKINKREGLLLAKIFQTDNDFWTRLQRTHFKWLRDSNKK
ncbi:HigA family addiction module antitoxin [Klebsiella grimontii]|uniref:HigA family addiction module antitoxin n=1 Tax=Klebsiella grimontii TaxID=2058152 RepID=UPI002245B6BB|nr:HigA family addiction module antitoxin [Klebsiella grimontii]MCW9525711.1 HigA family addiction module antitoxin [Klebsiella grimontii]HBN1142772.1 HigA family addiction module antidote protein [Escherichia coli]